MLLQNLHCSKVYYTLSTKMSPIKDFKVEIRASLGRTQECFVACRMVNPLRIQQFEDKNIFLWINVIFSTKYLLRGNNYVIDLLTNVNTLELLEPDAPGCPLDTKQNILDYGLCVATSRLLQYFSGLTALVSLPRTVY